MKKTINRIKEWAHWNLPLWSWWKARKLFKMPKCKLYIGKWGEINIGPIYRDNLKKFVHFDMYDVSWKWKFDEIRYEYPPYISLVFFRKWQVALIWTVLGYDECGRTSDLNTEYWEFLLTWLYRKDCEKNLWKSLSKIGYLGRESKLLGDGTRLYTLPQQISLNKNGQKQLTKDIFN